MIFAVNTMFIFISLFLVIITFSSFRLKSTHIKNRLFRIKNYGKANFKSVNSGVAYLRPLKLLLGNFFDLEYLFKKKKQRIIKAGLGEYVNTVDLFLIKILLLISATFTGSVYFFFQMSREEEIINILADNLVIISSFFILIAICSVGDEIVFSFLRKKRRNSVLNRLIFFINLFISNTLAGDNIYTALLSCSFEIPGLLGKEVEKTCQEFYTKGKVKALKNLSDRLDVDELSDFVNLLILGIDTTEKDFANFLKENEIRLQEIKESKALEKQASKPIYSILFNVLSFMAVVSIIIMPMLLSFISYLNRF